MLLVLKTVFQQNHHICFIWRRIDYRSARTSSSAVTICTAPVQMAKIVRKKKALNLHRKGSCSYNNEQKTRDYIGARRVTKFCSSWSRDFQSRSIEMSAVPYSLQPTFFLLLSRCNWSLNLSSNRFFCFFFFQLYQPHFHTNIASVWDHSADKFEHPRGSFL